MVPTLVKQWALLGPRSRVSRSRISQREMLGTSEIFASSITETLGHRISA